MTKQLTRIVTFMAHPDIIGTPRTLLVGGSRTVSYRGRVRVFVVRKVVYDDDMTPMYSIPGRGETRYPSLQELKDKHPNTLLDSPILDDDKRLKIWDNNNI